MLIPFYLLSRQFNEYVFHFQFNVLGILSEHVANAYQVIEGRICEVDVYTRFVLNATRG